MDKQGTKKKVLALILIVLFLAVYTFLFGTKNTLIGFMILFLGILTLSQDFSFNPKFSFIKMLFVFWAIALVAFYNSIQTTLIGVILQFILIFGITFTSFHIFNNNSYHGYLMGYFMMLCSPISIDVLPLRLIALFVGAALILAFNLLMNHNKQYKTSKGVIENLLKRLVMLLRKNLKVNLLISLILKLQISFI